MPDISDYVVYADFNCPFCHALNERAHLLDVASRVELRPIQHAPNVASQQCTFELLCELTDEVNEVRRRAPSTELVIPAFRPNTQQASLAMIAAMATDPAKARTLRRLIYRAYWVDGLDISDPGVIAERTRQAGFEEPLAIDAGILEQAGVWQAEWEQGDFDRSIPVTIPARGDTLIGFPAQRELDTFFTSGSGRTLPAPEASCAMKPPQKILALARDPKLLWTIIAYLRGYDSRVVDRPDELLPAISEAAPIDLLLIDVDCAGKNWAQLLAELRGPTNSDDGELPIVVAGPGGDGRLEAAAFEAGAVDFIAKPAVASVLRARLTTHLEMRHSRQVLRNLARLDSLTEVHNRREFDLGLQLEWVRAARTQVPVAVLMIDIDHFKHYNDHYGHSYGDECLRTVARLLNGAFRRPGDRFARYGGEEFAAVLPDTGLSGARAVAERCRRVVEEARIPHANGGLQDRITVSIGAASCRPNRTELPQALVEEADKRLYRAKHAGRNRVVSTD